VQKKELSSYNKKIRKAARLVEERYGKYYGCKAHHNVDAYRKSTFLLVRQKFETEFNQMRSHHMRSPEDIQRCIFSYTALAENLGHLKYVSQKHSFRLHIHKRHLYHKFEDAQEVSDALNSKMETSNESVGEIANSTKSTAESIEEQTHQTSDIQNSIVTVGQEAKAMGEISDRTSDSVLEGVELINQLKVQAQQVTEINMETKKTTEMLNISINDVQNITETIMSISSQTNLLALNASIEAARAGEAGKGFAVVADEIRTLSEGTRAATEKITAIIGKLIQDADSASNSMMKSAEFAQKQHELITTTGEKLADIKANTDELRVGLQNVNDSVESVINANTLMMDSITNLSALSEEVAASSDTVLAQSNESLDALRDMNGLLSEIKDISQKMEETCSK